MVLDSIIETASIEYCTPQRMSAIRETALRAQIAATGKIVPQYLRIVPVMANNCYYCPRVEVFRGQPYCTMAYRGDE